MSSDKKPASNGTTQVAVRPAPALDPETAELQQRAREAHKQFGRGKQIALKQIKDKKLKAKLRRLEERNQDAVLKAQDAQILQEFEPGYLEPEGELERTYKIRQSELKDNVGVETAKKGFELKLGELGPYVAEYSRNGRDLLLAGRKGHIATMDWRSGKLNCEQQLGETIRDATWLHNNQYFAAAQKKYTYMYDHHGVELHKLSKLVEATHLRFLPYHFLLAAAGNAGYLKYTDTSTGRLVSEFPTKLGGPTAMATNPWNAVVHLGHANGLVTLWSPSSTTPLVKLNTHRGPVRAMAVDREGRYMVCAGQDQKMSVWDVRTFKELNTYFLRRPASSVAISDAGLTAVGWGTQCSVWRGLFDKSRGDQQEKVQSPYMAWGGEGKSVERVRWCPFEDVLGISHGEGFASGIFPGAGEANFDALELNPYETTKQRQEAEVKMLLNKLQPEMISLNPDFVGNLDLASHETRMKEKDLDRVEEDEVKKLKNRGRGKNSSLRKHLRKKGSRNIIDERREKIEALRKETNRRLAKRKTDTREEELGPALARFVRKAPV
ncbi:MAG: Small subunit (SSU) processome component [Stictis urceolatum]|nr:Small subunit (SSU) processome component [Stictis urceolata]